MIDHWAVVRCVRNSITFPLIRLFDDCQNVHERCPIPVALLIQSKRMAAQMRCSKNHPFPLDRMWQTIEGLLLRLNPTTRRREDLLRRNAIRTAMSLHPESGLSSVAEVVSLWSKQLNFFAFIRNHPNSEEEYSREQWGKPESNKFRQSVNIRKKTDQMESCWECAQICRCSSRCTTNETANAIRLHPMNGMNVHK